MEGFLEEGITELGLHKLGEPDFKNQKSQEAEAGRGGTCL